MKYQILFTFATVLLLSGCGNASIFPPTPTPEAEDSSWPTPASTLPELIENISGDDYGAQQVSIYALQYYTNEPEIILPVLIENLRSNDSNLREAAAFVLGKMGSNATEAVPALNDVVLSEDGIHDREEAAKALGLIGDRRAVPALASVVLKEDQRHNYHVAMQCAKSISWLTGEEFTDSDSFSSYTSNADDIPYLVLDARKWWEQTGQYQDWDESE